MIKLKNSPFILILLSLLFVACEKEELPISPHNPGNVITNSIRMESDYRYQLFFDLATNKMVKRNLKVEWDLGFETTPQGNRIILNTSKLMFAANTQQTDFSAVTDTNGYNFKWDEPSGNMDSTAIGNWIGTSYVYVIDRGFNSSGIHQGFKKIIFESVSNTSYQVRFANLDGTEKVTYSVAKDLTYNFTFLSLNGNGNTVSIEPQKETWDLAFSQYTHVFHDQTSTTPYLVNGVLSNRNKVEISTIFNKSFEGISIDDITTSTFSTAINGIGYNWKEYSFSTATFTVFANQNYLIKSTEGKYYKLHFIDFYDNLGTKGTPTFEFQEL